MSSTAAPIVAGIDGSEPSRRALAWSIEEARLRGASLVAVMCAPEHAVIAAWGVGPSRQVQHPDDQEFLEKSAARLVEDVCVDHDTRGVEIHIEAHIGRASEHLVELSGDAQLVVVGARGHDRVSRVYLGSVAEAVTHRARCPVTVIP